MANKEYIEKETALEAVSSELRSMAMDDIQNMDDFIDAAEMVVRECLLNIPAADVAQVVHGRWICTDYDNAEWICTTCKNGVCLADSMIDPIEDANLNYCPNCGAKMDLGGCEWPSKVDVSNASILQS